MERKNIQNNAEPAPSELNQLNKAESSGKVIPRNTEPAPRAFTLKRKILSALAIIWVAPLVGLIIAVIVNSFSHSAQNFGEYMSLTFLFLVPIGIPGLVVHTISFGICVLFLKLFPFSRDYMRKPDKKLNINNALYVYLIAQTPLIVTMIVLFILLVFLFPLSGFQF